MKGSEFVATTSGFYSGDWRVDFLHSQLATACIITHDKRVTERYVGVAIRHPKDELDFVIGRHKAFRDCLEKSHYDRVFGNCIATNWSDLPVRQLQRDYWKRYAEEEK